MKAIVRIATFIVVTLVLALASTAWAETDEEERARIRFYHNYEFGQSIADAPKSIPALKGLYHTDQKADNADPRCQWYWDEYDKEWSMPRYSYGYRRIAKCCKKTDHTWADILELYLKGLVREAACYRDDYDLGIYIAYGGSFSHNYKLWPTRGIDDDNFREFLRKKILTSPKAAAALYEWMKPYVGKALDDMAPIDREMYIAAVKWGIKYLETADIKAEERYLRDLRKEEEEGVFRNEDWFGSQRPDGSYDRFRYVETFLFRRLQDGVSKKFLLRYLRKGLKLLKEHQYEGDTILARVEFVKEGLAETKRRYENDYRPYMEALQELGDIQEVCLTPRYYHVELPPKSELVKLSLTELILLEAKIGWYPYQRDLDRDTGTLEHVLIPEAKKEAARLAMYNKFMSDMDDLFGVCCMEP